MSNCNDTEKNQTTWYHIALTIKNFPIEQLKQQDSLGESLFATKDSVESIFFLFPNGADVKIHPFKTEQNIS